MKVIRSEVFRHYISLWVHRIGPSQLLTLDKCCDNPEAFKGTSVLSNLIEITPQIVPIVGDHIEIIWACPEYL